MTESQDDRRSPYPAALPADRAAGVSAVWIVPFIVSVVVDVLCVAFVLVGVVGAFVCVAVVGAPM